MHVSEQQLRGWCHTSRHLRELFRLTSCRSSPLVTVSAWVPMPILSSKTTRFAHRRAQYTRSLAPTATMPIAISTSISQTWAEPLHVRLRMSTWPMKTQVPLTPTLLTSALLCPVINLTKEASRTLAFLDATSMARSERALSNTLPALPQWVLVYPRFLYQSPALASSVASCHRLLSARASSPPTWKLRPLSRSVRSSARSHGSIARRPSPSLHVFTSQKTLTSLT